MLLAAGEGTRLRPYTERVPKPVLPLAGKPILEHNLDLLRRHGVREVIINLHHHPDAVTSYFGDGSAWGMHITYSFEEELLGTAGAVKRVESLLEGPFIVLYADNLTGCDLAGLVAFHRQRGGIGTIGVYECPDPTVSGIFDLSEDGRVLRFQEKPPPHAVFSNLANAGVYVLEREVADYIPDGQFSDFGRDVFPDLLRRGKPLLGWRIPPIVKVDTVEMYERVQVDLATGRLRLT
ncbi:MAG: nucleotidyltransferase family protein [Bacteroidetes bacterium]|nr:nucleotidyltransferase family protein [Bacteroidota bacterium]MCL5026930.1 nucleotidyltransferase family protein [Chloroflexota bacterium]